MSLDSSTSGPRSIVARTTRRQFGQAILGSAMGGLAAPGILRGRSLNEKLNIGMIGVDGRGAANLKEVASENPLGNVAYRTGKKLEWDAARLYAPDAEQFIRREYHKGWTLA